MLHPESEDAEIIVAIAMEAHAADDPITPRSRAVVDQFQSPAVVRSHRDIELNPPSTRRWNSRCRRFKSGKYMGKLGRNLKVVRELLRVAHNYPLCRFCLLVKGNIVEHSHPLEHDPRSDREVPARALTACARCNADERESLRLTCAEYGLGLRRQHVSEWPAVAQSFQVAELSRRVNSRRAEHSREVMPESRFARILKFDVPPS